MTLADILSKFDAPKKSGASYLARCRAHEDRKASLSIAEGRDGRIVLKCHAGCTIDAVLAAAGLLEADLFPAKDTPATIDVTYDYRDEHGTLLYQVVRLLPKDFRQRRPDGGGWHWNLTGVRRVLYRLPDLKGQTAVIVCEGEKDVAALVALGVPATTNAGGAGKWLDTYSEQLRRQGVERVAVLPDHDEPGQQHAQAVARSCAAAGLGVRVLHLPDLPPKGDVSDWLRAGGTKDQLLGLIRETPAWTPAIIAPARTFSKLAERHYTLRITPENILFDLTKIGRRDRSWWGQLAVHVNGACPDARHIPGTDGIITESDFNLTSDAAREKRAKTCAERSGNKELDWLGYVEQLSVLALRAEREGPPVVDLSENPVDATEEDGSAWHLDGFPLLQHLPMVLFGDSANGKSYFAMWLAGCLAQQGIPVLYCDWEFARNEHEKRLARLFQPRPAGIKYLKCEHPIEDEIERIQRVVEKYACKFVICDSVGFAIRGPAEYGEGATGYFNALRKLDVGTLNIAHIPKQRDDGKEAEIYGNNYFKHGARSIWFIQKAQENPHGELRFGLYHRKYNLGKLHTPLGYRLTFEGACTRLSSFSLDTVDELSSALPVKDRMSKSLRRGALTVNELAEEVNTTAATIRCMLMKHPALFMRVGKKIGLKESGVEF